MDCQHNSGNLLELRISQKTSFFPKKTKITRQNEQKIQADSDVKSPFTDFVLALELVFDALTHHRGYVQDQHLNAGLSLVLLLK